MGPGGKEGQTCLSTGKPIAIGTGNKWLVESDIALPMGELNGIQFQRYYNASHQTDNANLGAGWSHTYSRAIGGSSASGTAIVYRPEGNAYTYHYNASTGWSGDADIVGYLVETYVGGTRTGWTYITADRETETYNRSGQLISITDRTGHTQTLTYSDTYTPATTASTPGLLIQVSDSFGRHLHFTYDASNRIQTITDPAGRVYTYTTDSNNLTSVTYPDNKSRQYIYGETAHTGGASLPNALTGIVDENNSRYMTYKYNASGRAVEEESPLVGGNAEHNLLDYTTDAAGNPVSTTLTDALGTNRTYNFTTILGVTRSTGQTQPGGSGCSAAASNLSYDANGNIATRIDFQGHLTKYTYDLTRNLETSRIEANGRTITTQWHPSYRVPTVVAEPLRITTYTYDGQGNLLSSSIQPTSDKTGATGTSATAAGTARTTAYTYNSRGQVLTVNGARTDVSDVTSYAYDAYGKLLTVTNALNQTTTLGNYDANLRPGSLTDPNGLATYFSYDARGRLTSRSSGGETTGYSYDGVGQLKTVVVPSGASYTYTYDAAHRLTDIADSQNNTIHYTLDGMGNRTKEETFDSAGGLVQTHSRVFDALNRLWKDIGAINQTAVFEYDPNGNLTKVTDPLNRQTLNAYDDLNRLTVSTDAANGITHYDYDGLDQLVYVSDPKLLNTRYSRDGLGNLQAQSSPDTGTTVYTHDAAGNVLTRTDAKNQVATYTYDALNRLTGIVYSGGGTTQQTVAYTYDQGTNGIGHLTQIVDSTGTTNYSYDQHGRLTSEVRQPSANVSYTTGYSYDAQGLLSGITYPSGRTVSYTFDTQGRINSIASGFNGNAPTLLASNITYRPFGGVQSFTYGDGTTNPVQTYTRQHDQDGRIASYTLNGQAMSLGYDAASQISFISDPLNLANIANYSYDALSRLTGYTQSAISQGYGYDADGNRSTQTLGGTTSTYGYVPGSNKLTSIQTGAATQTLTQDANGATTSDATRQYSYDLRGRLIQTTTAQGVINYEVNALGLRTRKQVPYANTDTLYHYDIQGRLIGENENGDLRFTREYIWLADIPVGVMQ